MKNRLKILLGQLGRRGDCIFATTVARQIKLDYPGCHLTWAIGSTCKSIVENNPFIEAIWVIENDVSGNTFCQWEDFLEQVESRKKCGDFDLIFLTQVHPGNFQNYDGTSRSSIFRGYPHPITVPLSPVIRLSDQEVKNVSAFADVHSLGSVQNVILFECESTSGQSFITIDFALDVSKRLLNKFNSLKVIISSSQKINDNITGIIDGSVLSFKENAELTRYCSLLVGCSSGISWLSTSDWAAPIPQIQLLKSETSMYASMIHDAKYFNLADDQILEMQECLPVKLAGTISVFIQENFASAKAKYHVEIPIDFNFYLHQLYYELLLKQKYTETIMAISTAFERYRYNDAAVNELRLIVKNIISPYLAICLHNKDTSRFDDVCREIDPLQDRILLSDIFSSFIILFVRAIFGKYTGISRTLFMNVVSTKILLVKGK